MITLFIACGLVAPIAALTFVYRKDIAAYWRRVNTIADRVVVELENSADATSEDTDDDEFRVIARSWYVAGAFAALKLHTQGGVSEETILAEFEIEWDEAPTEQ